MNKKLLLTLSAGLLALSGLRAAPVFTTTLNTQEEFDLWQVKDVNEDQRTWIFSPSNDEGKRVYYNYGSLTADDWLISPEITIPTAGNYMVKYTYYGSSYNESMDVHMAATADLEALKAHKVASHPSINANLHESLVLFEAQAGQKVVLGFHAVSAPDLFRLYLSTVTVEECANPIDLALTEITAPVSGEGLGQETVSVKVENKGLVAVDSYSVTVAVNGEVAFTETVNQSLAPGASAVVTLQNKVDISVSHRTYTVSATVNAEGDILESNNSASTSVRNVGPAVEPYFMGFEDDEDTADIKYFNLNGDSGDWDITKGSFFFSFSRTGSCCLGYNYDKEHDADDWAILDGIKMEAGHHVLKFWVCATENHPERLAVKWGNAATPEAMTNELITIDPVDNEAYREVICIFELDQPQTVYIGFYCFSNKDENWLLIDDVTVDKLTSTELDIVAGELVNPSEYIPLNASRSVTFGVRNVGIVDAATTARVYVDGTQVATKEFTLRGQEDTQITVDDALANVAAGTHEVKVELSAELDKTPDNNVLTANVRVLGTPDILFDFEDEDKVDLLSFRSEDRNTLASDEFGENGWALMSIDTHPQYGENLLGCMVYFTNPEAEANRWCVLPQIHVDSDDACFAWNAGAYNLYGGTESYSACVSTVDDYLTDYSRILTVPAEGTTRRNRGISLGSYKGQDIYVALNVHSIGGNIINFDNLEVHGAHMVDDASLNVVEADGNLLGLAVNGDRLTVGGDAAIEVFDTVGNLVVSAQGASADLSGLSAGVYVARATTATATATLKFVRR